LGAQSLGDHDAVFGQQGRASDQDRMSTGSRPDAEAGERLEALRILDREVLCAAGLNDLSSQRVL